MEPPLPTLAQSEEAKQENAEAFRAMMRSSAWKQFEALMENVYAQALKDEDALPMESFTPAALGECRGRRNAIRKLRSDLGFIINAI